MVIKVYPEHHYLLNLIFDCRNKIFTLNLLKNRYQCLYIRYRNYSVEINYYNEKLNYLEKSLCCIMGISINQLVDIDCINKQIVVIKN